MGLSTGKDLHIDNHLTNLAINHRPQTLIADMIAPVIPVAKQSDSYPVFSRFEAFAIEDTVRAPRTEARKITRSVSSGQYQARNHALGYDVPIEDVANMDAALRFEMDVGASNFLQRKFGLAWEKRVHDLAVQTVSVGSVFVMNSSWAIAGANAGDPIQSIFQMLEYGFGNTGQKFNSLWFGWKAWNRFSRNYHVRNFFNGVNNGKGLVTRETARQNFEVDRLIVSEALYHTQNEAMTNSYPLSNPMEDQLIAYYAPLSPSRDDPSWFYTFRWQDPRLPAPLTVFRHPYDTKKRMETIEIDLYQDEKLVGPDYALRLITTAASGAAGLGI
jgi:hypothetical protein